MNVGLIMKFSSVVMQNKRRSCERHTRIVISSAVLTSENSVENWIIHYQQNENVQEHSTYWNKSGPSSAVLLSVLLASVYCSWF